MGMDRHSIVASSTGGSNQDIEIGSDGQPEGFFIFASNATSADTLTEDAQILFCCGDGTNYWGMGQASEGGGLGNSNCKKSAWDDSQTTPAAMAFLDSSMAVDGYFSIAARASWPTNGIRITWGAAPSLAYRLHVVFIDGQNCKVGTFSRNTSVGASTNVAPGFVADQVCVGSLVNTRDGSAAWADGGFFPLGWADWDGSSIVQAGVWQREGDNVTTTSVVGEISDNSIIHTNKSGGNDDRIEITSFTSGGGGNELVFTSRDQGGSNTAGYMAIQHNSGISHHMAHITHPVTTGNEDITATLGGDTPGFALVFHGGFTATNTEYNAGGVSDVLAYSMLTGSQNSCVSYGVGTTKADAYAKSYSATNAVYALKMDGDDTPTIVYDGTSSFIANGVRINYTTATTGTHKGYVLLVEADSTGSTPVITPQAAFRSTKNVAFTMTGASISDDGGTDNDLVIACTSGTITVLTAGTVSVSNNGTATVTCTGTPSELNTMLAAGVDYEQDGDTDDTITWNSDNQDPTSATQQTTAVTMFRQEISGGTQVDLNAIFARLAVIHTVAEDVIMTITVVDETGNTDVESTTITVAGIPPLVISPTTASLAGEEQTTFTASDGTAPYTFSILADTSNGATIGSSSGIYTAGTESGSTLVRVTDDNSEVADATVTVTVVTPPAIINDDGEVIKMSGYVEDYVFIIPV